MTDERNAMIEELISDDMNSIESGEAVDYLYNILREGFVGYNKLNNKELKEEYDDRFDYSYNKA